MGLVGSDEKGYREVGNWREQLSGTDSSGKW